MFYLIYIIFNCQVGIALDQLAIGTLCYFPAKFTPRSRKILSHVMRKSVYAYVNNKSADVPAHWLSLILMSLFQEDNTVGTNASLTYGLRLQR